MIVIAIAVFALFLLLLLCRPSKHKDEVLFLKRNFTRRAIDTIVESFNVWFHFNEVRIEGMRIEKESGASHYNMNYPAIQHDKMLEDYISHLLLTYARVNDYDSEAMDSLVFAIKHQFNAEQRVYIDNCFSMYIKVK